MDTNLAEAILEVVKSLNTIGAALWAIWGIITLIWVKDAFSKE